MVVSLLMAVLMPCAQGQQAPPLITVTGHAEVRVAPDLADLHFEVEMRGNKLKEVLAEHGEKTKVILAALKAGGIDEGDLQTSQVIITPVYRNERDGREESTVVSHYRVGQSVQATLRDIRKVAEVTAKAIEAGANRVGQVQLRSSRRRKHMDDARLSAVKAAREKAVAMATELGAKVGKPYSIQEIRFSGYPANFANAQAQNIVQDQGGEAAGEGTFEPGKISIQATVSVAFFLE
ncbi:MAG: SIMPL domain-containing protein [Planctomycetota bacterium]|jgi:uncharacterized protein YggE